MKLSSAVLDLRRYIRNAHAHKLVPESLQECSRSSFRCRKVLMVNIAIFQKLFFSIISSKQKKIYSKILKIRGDISDFVRNFGHFSRIFSKIFKKFKIFSKFVKSLFSAKKVGFIQQSKIFTHIVEVLRIRKISKIFKISVILIFFIF